MTLATPLLGLRGVGPKTAARLEAKGLRTLRDVLETTPIRWDDFRCVTPAAALVDGERAVVRCAVAKEPALVPGGKREFLEVFFLDGAGGQLRATWWYARKAMKAKLRPGSRWLVAGVPAKRRGMPSMNQPELTPDDDAAGAKLGVRVRYPEIEDVPRTLLPKLSRLAVALADEVPDGLPPELRAPLDLPPELRARLELPGQGEALAALHIAHENGADVEELNSRATRWQRRLALDELFFLVLAALRSRGPRAPGVRALACSDASSLRRFRSALGFAPTGAQRRVLLDDIAPDLAQPEPMHRLVQGDTGCGKTVVIYGACEIVMQAGGQAAVLAPTDILARQHAATLGAWARACGRRIALLVGKTPAAERRRIVASAAAGDIDIVVGTHALLTEDVRFSRLALAVIDEQHRFGVEQRAALAAKAGEVAPHVLVVSATPIPRSLALVACGDLAISIIDELPPGREPVRTKVCSGDRGRAAAFARFRQEVDGGAQGYIVCPRIEEAPALDQAAAVALAAQLAADWPDVSVGVIHGRLSDGERDATMDRFRRGEIRILVATTVIEVGVDVPNATAILIESAERFGLAQLHQLRGRAARGPRAGICLLVTDGTSGDALERLRVMERTSDGFEVAERDLELRGPGDIFGVEQAGLPRLRHAHLGHDLKLLALARDAAVELLRDDPDLVRHPITLAVLEARVASAGAIG